MTRIELKAILEDLKTKLKPIHDDPDLEPELKRLSSEDWWCLLLAYEIRGLKRQVRELKKIVSIKSKR